MNTSPEYGRTEDRLSADAGTAKARDNERIAWIRTRIDEFAKKQGRRPRILVSRMGQNGQDHETKQLAAAFAELGFDVDISPLHQTPRKAARMAVENDVHVLCWASSGKGLERLAERLAAALQAEGGEAILMAVGGPVSKADYDFLSRAGLVVISNSNPIDIDAVAQMLDGIEQKR
ncbi:MAG: hypothetical protein JSW39_28905 [Desulfobacterales bacterium]|nr:MAG: hypothetical protein JSW39_28905 [Desulfobacterales bacterium]